MLNFGFGFKMLYERNNLQLVSLIVMFSPYYPLKKLKDNILKQFFA